VSIYYEKIKRNRFKTLYVVWIKRISAIFLKKKIVKKTFKSVNEGRLKERKEGKE
jgi:hypothetical protein